MFNVEYGKGSGMTQWQQEREYRGVIAEVHYRRRDGVYTYGTGCLTTEHGASSRGLPVYVHRDNMRRDDPLLPGVAYGPQDLPDGYRMTVLWAHRDTAPDCLPVAARSAGYRATAQQD